MVDAPVSGGSEGARNATLTIFVGGDERDVELARPVLNALGRTITHVGPIGAGQAVKAVNQVILAGTYLGVAEGIVLAADHQTANARALENAGAAMFIAQAEFSPQRINDVLRGVDKMGLPPQVTIAASAWTSAASRSPTLSCSSSSIT